MLTESKTTMDQGWRFDNSYTRLPEVLFTRTAPVPVPRPEMVIFNEPLAASLGLDAKEFSGSIGAEIFGGNQLPKGAEPIAQAYAGHQFGYFTNLGDGRAILLGEQMTPDANRFDIQLKGAGQTPYSRRGDGRAALGPMLREYLVSEAMHHLEIPTTRSLAVVVTGENIVREELLPGAVLTRVAASHLRVGTFEYAAALPDHDVLRVLLAYTIRRHDPELAAAERPARALLEAVSERQAALVAKWMLVGFIHGVMNTDNMALSGETIDYGPCAFMDAYDPATVFSSIDRNGRYAYGNQSQIAQWNLARLAEALLPLLHENEKKAIGIAEEVLGAFTTRFLHHWLSGMRAKLGLRNEEVGDSALAEDLLAWMQQVGADFTNTFAALALPSGPSGELFARGDFTAWLARWQARLKRQAGGLKEAQALMRLANPVVIPRNHRVEEALSAARAGDMTVFHRLLEVLARPYEVTPANEPYRTAPPIGGEPYRTFCGT
jgi:uncharacterized protein YdiU (UPF0061 family)